MEGSPGRKDLLPGVSLYLSLLMVVVRDVVTDVDLDVVALLVVEDVDLEVVVDVEEVDTMDVEVVDVEVLVVDVVTGLNTAASSVYLSYVPAVQLTGKVLDPEAVAK